MEIIEGYLESAYHSYTKWTVGLLFQLYIWYIGFYILKTWASLVAKR